jgi:LAO/AO transport system kinase
VDTEARKRAHIMPINRHISVKIAKLLFQTCFGSCKLFLSTLPFDTLLNGQRYFLVPLSEIENLLNRIRTGDERAIARGITIVENGMEGADQLLGGLQHTAAPKLVGITGPPGAGKSTLVNSLLGICTTAGKKVAVIAVDPSSPFHYGSLLGDRIRMSKYYNHPQVFIRSLASRGALGGLHPRIFEITDVVKEAGFDIIIIETVGVGQSEVEIAGIADCTVVTLVPEAGDMIQTMKAGLLEIADIFVVNKSDREESETIYQHLRVMAHERAGDTEETPVLKTISITGEGVRELADAITKVLEKSSNRHHKMQLLLQKAWHLVQEQRMNNISRPALAQRLETEINKEDFNIYTFARSIAAAGLPVPQ